MILTTLDGVERKLDPNILMIADGERSVALAGIMGGEETEVKEDTKNLLIEVANFEKDNIRESSKKIGLRSEASSKFEKGVDVTLPKEAAYRVCQLIDELGVADAHPAGARPFKRADYVRKFDMLTSEIISKKERDRFISLVENLADLTPAQVQQLNVQVDIEKLTHHERDRKGIF